MTDEDDDTLIPLAFELMTSSMGGDDEEFVAYVTRRLDETLTKSTEAYRLIALLASFGGEVVSSWASDTDRQPTEVMQSIGLALAEDTCPGK